MRAMPMSLLVVAAALSSAAAAPVAAEQQALGLPRVADTVRPSIQHLHIARRTDEATVEAPAAGAGPPPPAVQPAAKAGSTSWFDSLVEPWRFKTSSQPQQGHPIATGPGEAGARAPAVGGTEAEDWLGRMGPRVKDWFENQYLTRIVD